MWKRTRKFIKRRLLSNTSSNENQFPIWILFFAAVALAYASLLMRHGDHLWQRDYFQFYPVFVAGVLFLTVQRIRNGALPPKRVWRIEPVSMIMGVAIIPLATLITSPWLAAVSFWLIGNSLLCGNRLARQSWRLLVILIPLPLGNDRWLVQKLQQISSAKASVLLDTFDVPHLMRGNVLELADKRFFVEEACSGISSVYLLLATTWFCLVWNQTRAIRGIPLLLSVFWWAVVANILRIFGIAAVHHYWQVDLSTGMFHQLMGLAVLGCSFGMVLLTMQLLDFLFAPIGDGTVIRDNKVSLELTPTVLWNLFTVRDPVVAHGTRQKLPMGINVHRKLLLYSLSIFLMVVGTAHLGQAYMPTLLNNAPQAAVPAENEPESEVAGFDILGENLFKSIDNLSVVSFEQHTPQPDVELHTRQTRSKVWVLNSGSIDYRVSISGPFTAWHDLRTTYESQNWKVVHSDAVSKRLPGDDSLMAAQLIDSEGQPATLYFCQFANSGARIEVPGQTASENLVQTFRERLQQTSSDESWQLQMLVRQSGHVIDAQIQTERNLFKQLLRITLKDWRGAK